jgi:hypothetical protein
MLLMGSGSAKKTNMILLVLFFVDELLYFGLEDNINFQKKYPFLRSYVTGRNNDFVPDGLIIAPVNGIISTDQDNPWGLQTLPFLYERHPNREPQETDIPPEAWSQLYDLRMYYGIFQKPNVWVWTSLEEI